MSDLNKILLVGRLADNAETKITSKQLFIANFTLATNRAKKNDDGTWGSKVSFFPLSLYGKRAEGILKYLVQGQRVYIEGYLEQRKWEQDGKKMSKMEIRVDDIQLLSFKTLDDIPADFKEKKQDNQSNPHLPDDYEFTGEEMQDYENEEF